MTRVTKFIAREHSVNGGFRFGLGHCDNDAFASSEAVGFYYDRGALRTNVSFSCLDFGKGLIACGRDCVAFQKIFGKRFRPFELRRCLARSEAGEITATKIVDDACD